MSDLFLGWHAEAWNCDRNPRTRDALCALEARGGDPVVVGRPWRGNVRELLMAHDGRALTAVLLEHLGVVLGDRHLTIAIDTPLAWPQGMVNLVARGAFIDFPANASTKGIHFLTGAGLAQGLIGVWSGPLITAIETNPSQARALSPR